MMKIKVSIIVPVYNNEKYLRRCLESLVNQTLKDIEIILINDCSTDKSIDILNGYEEKYSEKITLINLNENKRPGGARNRGIEDAKGEYLGFVDSDDYVEKDMYEQLYNLASSGNYDMVDCGFYNGSAKNNALTTIEKTWGELNLEKRRHLVAYPGFLWSKIIRRSIIVDNNIKFREKITFEDIDFLPVVMLYLKKVYATDLVLYYYSNNLESITSNGDENIQIEDKMNALRCLVKKFKEHNAYEDYKEEITFHIYLIYIYMLQYCTLYLDEGAVNYDIYKVLQKFFFELVDYDYHNNKYISTLDKKKIMYAEINNLDYKMILDTCKANG